MSHTQRTSHLSAIRAIVLVGALVGLATSVRAASTDIASAPLSTASDAAVKPNLLFILDDSGSMNYDYLPDEANFAASKYGRKASQCNGVAYNPAVVYKPPIDSTGASHPLGSSASLPVIPNDLSSIRTISSAEPTVATGSLTVTLLTGSGSSYDTGDVVTLYSDTDRSRLMGGTVTAWNGTSRVLTVNVTGISGSGALTAPRVGTGNVGTWYFKYAGSQSKLNYEYNSSGVITSSNFYKECDSAIDSKPAIFTRVLVAASSADAQNYANWYAYYRTRMELMKASTSLAFRSIGDRFRVGFTTIRDKTVTSSQFLNVDDFDPAHKLAFYTNLFAATPSSFTPLRGALSKAGQYYAKKASGQTYDPIQYSCQKNFTVLSTDGYWNTDSETSSYGPFRLDRSTNVGQQDGVEPIPYWDGVQTTVTKVEKYSKFNTTVTTEVTPKTTVATSTTTTTTTTPDKGWTLNQYSAPKYTYSTFTNDDFDRCSNTSGPCTITVDTNGSHGFQTGNMVTVAGVGTAAYNGTFSITRLDNNTYTYVLPSRPGSVSGSKGTSFYSPVGCPSGQGKLVTQARRRDENKVSITSDATTTTTPIVQTVVTTSVTTTPVTVTTTTVNGLATTSTVNGTATTSSSPVTTNVSGTATQANTSSTTAGANTFSAWVDYGAPVVSGSCASNVTLPSPNPSNATALAGPSATVAVVTGPTTATTSSTTSGAPTTTVVGPTASQGASAITSNTTTANGVSDSLADVAMYYYNTDLRDASLGNCVGALGGSSNVCENNVAPKGVDDKVSQHMTTFTLGLGVNGLMKYDADYLKQASGSYFDITQGTVNWPIPGPSKSAENIDDLWHAAVNGRGQYFSAGDPVSLASSLDATLQSINERLGSGSGAAASSLQPTQGEDKVFIGLYVTSKWIGDVVAKTIDVSDGHVLDGTVWSAQQKLDARVAAGTPRSIYYFKKDASANTGMLRSFTHSNLTTDALNANFDNVCAKAIPLSQCATLAARAADTSVPADAAAASLARSKLTGDNVVQFLGGTRTYEQSATIPGDQAFRARASVLGDIVGGAPAYVKKSPFKYADSGYAAFVASTLTRAPMLYAAANDGMLHAFDAATGEEKWAYIPSMVLPNMYRLADADYANRHEYFVDGAPVVADIYAGGAWKTILVGGLGAGGRGYYALDITNPDSPRALWEFTHTDLGLTFGNAVIAKKADGTWIVTFASGYNNNINGGDGNGHLFVLNANTGVQLLKVPTNTSGTTPAGTAATPSGMAKINAWIESDTDNTAKRFYGGDLLGNLWRFDIDGLIEPKVAAHRVAELKVGTVPQPITTAPQPAEVTSRGATYQMIYVASGQYLGASDLSSAAQQTIYGLKDDLTTTGLGDVHSSSAIVAQTLSQAGGANTTIKVSKNDVDWATKSGWRVDLLITGERVNINPRVVFNTLVVVGNTPKSDACTVGGSSFLYQFDLSNGSSPLASGDVGVYLGNALGVGTNALYLAPPPQACTAPCTPPSTPPPPPTDLEPVVCTTQNDGTIICKKLDKGAPTMGATKRTSWRELIE